MRQGPEPDGTAARSSVAQHAGRRNRGGHALLRDGAKIVESADDILEEIGLATTSKATVLEIDVTDPVLAHLSRGESYDLDTLAERSGLPVARLLPRLCELELEGRVGRRGGRRRQP